MQTKRSPKKRMKLSKATDRLQTLTSKQLHIVSGGIVPPTTKPGAPP